MKKRETMLIYNFVFALIIVFAGCASTSQGSKTYTRNQAQSPLTAYSGTVLRVADVQIQTETSGAVGGIAGAVMGGVLGPTVGGGGCRRVATTAGALGGAAVGSAAEGKMRLLRIRMVLCGFDSTPAAQRTF